MVQAKLSSGIINIITNSIQYPWCTVLIDGGQGKAGKGHVLVKRDLGSISSTMLLFSILWYIRITFYPRLIIFIHYKQNKVCVNRSDIFVASNFYRVHSWGL